MSRSSWSSLLYSHRQKMRIDQDILAKMLGVSQAAVSHYESGQTLPPLAHLRELCDILGLTGNERITFQEEAFLAHAPDRVRAMVAEQRQRIARLERAARLKGIELPA